MALMKPVGSTGPAIQDQAVSIQRLQLLLDNVPIAQVECLGSASLAVEIILQFAHSPRKSPQLLQ